MADRWIVSSHRFAQHKTEEIAQAEAERLRKLVPKKDFRVYRVKTTLQQSNAGELISSLTQALQNLYGLCCNANPNAFENGVVEAGMDEGNAIAASAIDNAKTVLLKAGVGL
jgi:hypothetical protein